MKKIREIYSKIENIFITCLIPLGILYLVFVVPYHVPDEAPHIIRAYETYQGEFIASLNEEGKHRAIIPKDFKNLNLSNLKNYETLKEQMSQATNYDEVEEAYTEAQAYPGIVYLISGLGMLIGKLFNLNIITAMYIARLFNFTFFAVLSYFAVKKIPFGKLLLSAYILMPMVLQQAASVSPDSVINAVCIFFIAYVLHLAFAAKKISKKEIAMIIAMSAFIAIAKVVYLPIVFLLLLLIQNKNIDRKQKTFLIVSSIIIAVIVGGTWYLYQTRYQDEREYVKERNINSTEQIKNIIFNPIGYLGTLKNTINQMGATYLFDMVGASLGWQNIAVPQLMIIMYLILILMAGWLENHKVTFSNRQKIFAILISLSVIILVFTGLYIGWTEVGAKIIVGVQGRYFIPIAILLTLTMCFKNNYVEIKNIKTICFILIALINFSAISSIIQFFQ